MKKMILCVVMMLSVLTGCGSTTDTKSNEDIESILNEMASKFDTYKSYTEAYNTSGKMLSVTEGEDKAKLTSGDAESVLEYDVRDEVIYNVIKGKNSYGPFTTLIRKIKNQEESLGVITFENDTKVSQRSPYNKYEAEGNNTIRNSVDYYLKETKQFFKLSMENSGQNKIITISCVDLKGYQNYVNDKNKKENSKYDPLKFAGAKISKNEMKEIKNTYTISENGELLSRTSKSVTDYGDGLIQDIESTSLFSKYNSTNIEVDKINKIIDMAKNGETIDKVEW